MWRCSTNESVLATFVGKVARIEPALKEVSEVPLNVASIKDVVQSNENVSYF